MLYDLFFKTKLLYLTLRYFLENGIYQLLLKISRIHDNEEIFYLAGNTEGLVSTSSYNISNVHYNNFLKGILPWYIKNFSTIVRNILVC